VMEESFIQELEFRLSDVQIRFKNEYTKK
jgi:hypothetical protein